MRRASQWLQYDGLRYAVEATHAPRARRGRSRGSSTSRSRTRGARRQSTGTASRSPRTAASRARIAAHRARSSRRARGAGATRCARASRRRPARLVDLDGTRRRRGRRRDRGAARRASRTTSSCSTSTAQPLRDDAHRDSRAAARPARARRSSSRRRHAARTRAPSRRSASCSGRRRRQRARPAAGRVARRVGAATRAEGWNARRLAHSRPDGSPVDGLRLRRRTTVTYERRGAGRRGHPRRARAAGDRRPAAGSCPGVFYGENRPRRARASIPRFTPGHVDVERMESDAWSFRADRCATPAVFARGGGLVTTRGAPARPGGRRLRVPRRHADDLARLPVPRGAAPLRRLRDAGAAGRADVPLAAGRARRARRSTSSTTATARAARSARTPCRRPAAGCSVEEAAELAACGLYRWHYKPDPPRLIETAAFDRDAFGDGRPRPHARLVGERRTVRVRAAAPRHGASATTTTSRAAEAVLDHIAGNLTPGGTYWPQWTHDRGWTWGWHPDRTRAHARTLADAALFMLRAGGRWEDVSALERRGRAARRSATTARSRPRTIVETGDAVAWEGTAGMAWIPALVAAGELDAAAPRRRVLRAASSTWYGAPEDVDLAPTSEDGYAALMAFVALEDWENARRAADWLLTFRYTYDVDFSDETLLGEYGFRTRGADQASPANQHLHAFGLDLPAASSSSSAVRSATTTTCRPRARTSRASGSSSRARTATSTRTAAWRASAIYQTDCFQAKGMLLHAVARVERRRAAARLRGRAGARAVRRFPDGFMWGVATSAYQIEGAVDADGRGPSIWDDFPTRRARSMAADRRRRVRPLPPLARGRRPDRFARRRTPIASRSRGRGSMPTGAGAIEQRGIDHYDRLIDALLERGIEPVVTLYHWDLPQALEDEGGWRNRDTARALRRVRGDLLRRVRRPGADWWLTINEPWIVGLLGYLLGLHAPGIQGRPARRGDGLPPPAARARPRGRRSSGAPARRAASGSRRTWRRTTRRATTRPTPRSSWGSDGYVNRWFLDPVFRGSYPDDMRARYEALARPARLHPRRRPRDDRRSRPTFSASTTTRRAYMRGARPATRPGRGASSCPKDTRDRPAASPTASSSTEAGTPIVPQRSHRPARPRPPRLWASADPDHGERWRLQRIARRRRPRARRASHRVHPRPPRRAARRDRAGGTGRRLLPLVAARQLRVEARLRTALRARPRRLRHARADDQGQRSLLRAHRAGERGDRAHEARRRRRRLDVHARARRRVHPHARPAPRRRALAARHERASGSRSSPGSRAGCSCARHIPFASQTTSAARRRRRRGRRRADPAPRRRPGGADGRRVAAACVRLYRPGDDRLRRPREGAPDGARRARHRRARAVARAGHLDRRLHEPGRHRHEGAARRGASSRRALQRGDGLPAALRQGARRRIPTASSSTTSASTT